jgi:hemerythrin-like domain-containing protein
MAEFPGGTAAEHAFAEHEHRDLAPGIHRIHALARAGTEIPPAEWARSVLNIIDWVDTVLKPHVAWEDSWLYPEIARLAGTPWATRLMTFEHHQILDVARRLKADGDLLRGEPTRDGVAEHRGLLFQLEALLRAHIEREERFLIPQLEATAEGAAMRPRSA